MSMRNKLFIYSVLISAFFTAGLIYDRVATYRKTVSNVYATRAVAMQTTISEIAASALGKGSPSKVREALSPFTHLPSLAYLRISDISGRVVFRSAEPGITINEREVDRTPEEVADGIFDLESPLTDEDQKLGNLRLGVRIAPIKDNVENLLWRGIALGTVFLLILAMVLWLVTRKLGADMLLLSEAAAAINAEELPPLPAAPPGSDIHGISAAMRDMHAQLTQERRLRKETEEIKNDFFAMAVHDLKQPVTILKAVHQLMIEASQEGSTYSKKEAARMAYLSGSSMDRLNAMINDMLSISKLSSPDIPVQKDRIALKDFLKDCEVAYSPAVSAAGRKWHFDAAGAPRDAWLFGDRDLLLRLIGNLVMNAIHYTPEGGAINLGARPHDAGRVKVFVGDEGSGIPESFRTEIFKKYSSLSKTARNVGLGLAFCKLVADKHSALMDVRSEEGKGTEIALIIPVSAPEASAK